ncbi:hypothetical protein [Paenilisteria newyorkensis]|uniref:hypothetical protein n=1 Tax=Listeria newyorkensis TaxID=1497681 RepID=UPI00235899B0|nr:hypothetical protein [Listeria newyorkensis]WAO22069.2 hypothetical protein OTR81_01895 [Listeria newyorkensis]
MKTVEFKQKVEELGYKIMTINIDETQFRIYNNDVLIVVVNKNKFMGFDTAFEEFGEVGEHRQLELGSLIFEYAATPLDEREPERKWYLRDPVISDESFNYLKINRKTGTRTYGEKYDYGDNWQTSYTRAEIEAFTFPTEHLIEDEVSE